MEERDGCYYKIYVTGAMGVPAQKSEIELWEKLEEVSMERDAVRKDNDDLDDENNDLGELRTDNMLMIEAQKQEIARLKDLLSPPFEPPIDYEQEEISKADELEARQERAEERGYRGAHTAPPPWQLASDRLWESVRDARAERENMMAEIGRLRSRLGTAGKQIEELANKDNIISDLNEIIRTDERAELKEKQAKTHADLMSTIKTLAQCREDRDEYSTALANKCMELAELKGEE